MTLVSKQPGVTPATHSMCSTAFTLYFAEKGIYVRDMLNSTV